MFSSIKQKFRVNHTWDLIGDNHPLPQPFKQAIMWAATFTFLVVWRLYLGNKLFRSVCNFFLEGATILMFKCSKADLQLEILTYRNDEVMVEREPLFLK